MIEESIYLGKNLSRAISPLRYTNRFKEAFDEKGRLLLFLDGREERNPAAYRAVAAGVYAVTETMGQAPGTVSYYGVRWNV